MDRRKKREKQMQMHAIRGEVSFFFFFYFFLLPFVSVSGFLFAKSEEFRRGEG